MPPPRAKSFYEEALGPLGMTLLMEPVPEVGGFGAEFPFFWIANRGRGPDSGAHVAFRPPIARPSMLSTTPRSLPVGRTTAGPASGS